MRVAIVGGGIGGLTLAIALRQRGIVAIRRARLQQILVSQLPTSSVHLGRRCRRVMESAGIASAEFEDGSMVGLSHSPHA